MSEHVETSQAAKPARTPKTSRRTAPKEVRRRQLIEATIDCIAELGISRTTMAAVTGKAGLSMGIVSLHFASKDNLLTETLAHLSEEVRATWVGIVDDPHMGIAEKMKGVALASFNPAIFNAKTLAVWFAFFGEARYRAFYRQMVQSYDEERGDVLCNLCGEIIRQTPGDSRKPEVLTDAIESFGDGLWLYAMLYPEVVTGEYAHAQMVNFLAAYFPGHFQPVAQPEKGECAE